jgi:hypothetical protein
MPTTAAEKRQGKKFRSRVSVIMLIFLLASLLSPFVLISIVCAVTGNWSVFTAIILICVFGVLPLLFTLFCALPYCTCIVTETTLHIAFDKIPIADICRIKRSYNPLSAPAASFKRLAVYRTVNGKQKLSALISPVREQEFLDTLKAINPSIQISVTNKRRFWRLGDWDI